MSQDHRIQQQRFELKYLIDETMVPRLRDFVSSYLELDEYGAGRPNFAYAVHSIYLDSGNLETFHSTFNGTKNRFKLRLRYYDERPDTPVFFEVKARVDGCILKQRCGVRREAVAPLAAGQLPEPDQMFSGDPRHLAALQRFHLLQTQLQARPKAHNCYLREAWVSRDGNPVRVTFDRQIRIEPCFEVRPELAMRHPARVFPEFVVLELKFTTRFPDWLRMMVRHFHLMQSSSAKYAAGVLILGEHRFHDGFSAVRHERASPDWIRDFAATSPRRPAGLEELGDE